MNIFGAFRTRKDEQKCWKSSFPTLEIGDISFAVKQYLALTGDVELLQETENGVNGCDFVRKMAEFWISRMSYNAATQSYDINEVQRWSYCQIQPMKIQEKF